MYNLPPEMINRDVAEVVANNMGRMVAYGALVEGSNKRRFLRVKVELDVEKALIPGFTWKRRGMDPLWVDFKYEKLPMLCSICNHIGHEARLCDKASKGKSRENVSVEEENERSHGKGPEGTRREMGNSQQLPEVGAEMNDTGLPVTGKVVVAEDKQSTMEGEVGGETLALMVVDSNHGEVQSSRQQKPYKAAEWGEGEVLVNIPLLTMGSGNGMDMDGLGLSKKRKIEKGPLMGLGEVPRNMFTFGPSAPSGSGSGRGRSRGRGRASAVLGRGGRGDIGSGGDDTREQLGNQINDRSVEVAERPCREP